MMIFSTFLLAFLSSMILVPIVNKVCLVLGLVDQPNKRKIHVFAIPRLGGVAIFASFVLAIFLVRIVYPIEFDQQLIAISVGGVGAFLIGFFDDVFTFSSKLKLLLQILLSMAVFYLGFTISLVDIGFVGQVELGFLSMPITVFWIVLVMNAFNMIDGMDGQSSSNAMVSFFAIGILSWVAGIHTVPVIVGGLTASCLGFYVFNYHPAKIFMGDSGSLFLGFCLAVLSVLVSTGSNGVSVWTVFVLLAYPLFEITFSISRRAVRQYKESKRINVAKIISKTMSADGDHFHHRLLGLGLGQRQVNAIVVFFTALSGLLGVFFYYVSSAFATFMFVVYAISVFQIVKVLRYKELSWRSLESIEKEHAAEKKINASSIIRKV